MRERDEQRLHLVRRNTELTRKSERAEWVPTYHERYENGQCVSARYAGHRRVPKRDVAFPNLKDARGTASAMAPLTANLTRLDLTRASARQLQQWSDAR